MTLKEQALSLYKLVFYEDDENFANAFTEKYFDKCCRYELSGGKMVAMLYLLDASIFDGKETYPALYLYAAATHPEYRNQGIMSKLINSACKEGKTIVTKPATQELFGFYEGLGFSVCSFKDKIEKEFPKEEILNKELYIALRKNLIKTLPHIILSDEEFALDGFTLYGNGTYCAAVDEEGKIKEYISGELSKSNPPFAMWNKKEEGNLYFGLAMD